MITIDYIEDDEEFYVSFGGQHFNHLYSFVKSEGFKFNPKIKTWKSDDRQTIKSLLEYCDSLNETPNISFEKSILDEVDSKRESELVYFRKPFDRALIAVEPLKGKHPYENYQIDEIKKGISKNRHAYFLPMGFGKTLIMTAVISHFLRNGQIEKALIVCPTNALINIKRELVKFSSIIKEHDILIVTNDNKEEAFGSHIINIMAYHTFIGISDMAYKEKNKGILKKYVKPPLDLSSWSNDICLFCDESHYIKSHSSLRSRVLLMHRSFFKFRYILTGTPITKYFNDIYTQIKLLDESLVPKDYFKFLKDIASIGNRFSPYAINFIKKDRQEVYENIFSHLVSKYNADDVLDLPELIINKDYIELPKLQKEIYRAFIEYSLSKIIEENGYLVPKKLKSTFQFVSLALDNPKLLLKHEFSSDFLNAKIKSFRSIKQHGKFEACKELIDEWVSEGKKITIFDAHPSVLDELAEQFKKYNPIVIHGQIEIPKNKTTSQYREELLDNFKEKSNCNLLLAQQSMFSVAINLQCCSRVLYFSRTYSLVDWVQSLKRFHRPLQKEKVIVHVLIFEETLDERLDSILEGKKQENDELFMKDTVSKEEIKDFFSGK